jgi:outer membrane protein TolC
MVTVVSWTAWLPAQNNQRVLTLDDAIIIALDKSFETITLGLTLQGAEYGLDAAKGRFKTNAQLNLQTPDFTERVQEIRNANSLPVFNTLGTTRFQSTLDIIQPLPTNGRFTLRSTFYHRNESLFLTESEEDINRNEFFTSINLQFQQPIFTFNRLKAGFERANLNFERAQRRFKRTELDIVFRVTDAFFRLHRSTRQVEISKGEVERQRGSYELALKKFEAGLIPEVESLQMEVDFARSRNSLLEAAGDLTREQDRFKQLIGLELNENVAVDTRFDYTPFAVDQEFAVTQAIKNRSEIRELEIEKRLAELDVKQVDSRSELRIDLLAFLDITGISDPSLTSTRVGDLIESSFDDIGRRPTNKGVTLNMSVPLWDWGVNKNEVAEAQSALDESILTLEEQRKTVAREVRAVISQVVEAQNRLEVLKRSEEIAQKSYDISLARFENGDITSQELALDRDRLTAAKTDFLNAYITYQVATADLKRKTWWDFENNRSLVED